MMSAEASSKASNNGSSNRTKRSTSSGAPVTKSRRRSHVTDAPQIGSMSSPLAPTQPGLTPQKVRRRASSQLSPRDMESPPYDLLSYAGEFQETEFDMDTPSRKPGRRLRSASSASSCAFESSPLRQEHAQRNALDTDIEQDVFSRPVLEKSHTSPEMHEEAERRHQRPDLPVRGASDPVTRKSQSTSHIERDLHNLIKDGPSAKNREQQIGNIYLFKVKSATTDVELLKIGRTKKPAETRRKQIKGVCQHIHIEEHRRAVAEVIDFHGYAEKLVHTELANFQHQWVCSCGTSHQEYFDVREDLAVEVFTRWRDFCKQKPWAPDGKILPAWEQRLANKPKFGGDEHEPDHWELAKHWRRFTSPMAVERIASDAIRVWKDLFPERWQFVAIAELLTIICVSPISFWITTWAVVIGSLLLIDLVVIPDLHLFKWIDRLMSGGLQPFRWGGGGEQGGKGDCNLSASPEGHGMQAPTLSERPTRGVNHPTFTSMYVGRHDDPSIMADSSPGAFPSVSPGATDCESDMEVGVCCSPCAEKASRRRTPDIRVDPASANPEVTVDENFDMEVVE